MTKQHSVTRVSHQTLLLVNAVLTARHSFCAIVYSDYYQHLRPKCGFTHTHTHTLITRTHTHAVIHQNSGVLCCHNSFLIHCDDLCFLFILMDPFASVSGTWSYWVSTRFCGVHFSFINNNNRREVASDICILADEQHSSSNDPSFLSYCVERPALWSVDHVVLTTPSWCASEWLLMP